MTSAKENILRELEGRLRLKVASEAATMPEDPADKGTVAIPQPTAEEKKQQTQGATAADTVNSENTKAVQNQDKVVKTIDVEEPPVQSAKVVTNEEVAKSASSLLAMLEGSPISNADFSKAASQQFATPQGRQNIAQGLVDAYGKAKAQSLIKQANTQMKNNGIQTYTAALMLKHANAEDPIAEIQEEVQQMAPEEQIAVVGEILQAMQDEGLATPEEIQEVGEAALQAVEADEAGVEGAAEGGDPEVQALREQLAAANPEAANLSDEEIIALAQEMAAGSADEGGEGEAAPEAEAPVAESEIGKVASYLGWIK